MSPEGALLAAAWDSQRASLQDLYRAEADSLLRLAALMLPNVSDAEEVVQEAFVRSYLAWPRLEDPDRAVAFLRSAVLNEARSRIRRQKVAARLRLRSDASPSAEQGALTHIQRAELAKILQRLSARQRECVVLRHYVGLTEKETAEIIGVQVGSVKTHCHRGLARLARMMGPEA
jgi:RNA polymerase sigma-70 factor (sigma-E family)